VKLLFDENLSHRLVSKLADLFPDSTHVRDVGLKSMDDPLVWDFAKSSGSGGIGYFGESGVSLIKIRFLAIICRRKIWQVLFIILI
jgi:hypothetical protein